MLVSYCAANGSSGVLGAFWLLPTALSDDPNRFKSGLERAFPLKMDQKGFPLRGNQIRLSLMGHGSRLAMYEYRL